MASPQGELTNLIKLTAVRYHPLVPLRHRALPGPSPLGMVPSPGRRLSRRGTAVSGRFPPLRADKHEPSGTALHRTVLLCFTRHRTAPARSVHRVPGAVGV